MMHHLVQNCLIPPTKPRVQLIHVGPKTRVLGLRDLLGLGAGTSSAELVIGPGTIAEDAATLKKPR